MKTNLSKEKPSEISLAPATATSPGETIPPGMEHIAKLQTLSPRDFVTQLFAPKLKDASDEAAKLVVEAFAGMFSPIPQFFDFRVQLPEWVKAAAKRYWALSGIDFIEMQKGNVVEVGKCIGLMEIPSAEKIPPEIEKAATIICDIARADAAKSRAKDARQFFSEVEKAERTVARMKEPPKRIKAFLFISMAWRHVEKLENAGQLHRWLVEIGAFDGSITDPAETRKICRLIGLKLSNKAGRPAQQK